MTTALETKICSTCRVEKEATTENFYPDYRSKISSLAAECKTCFNGRQLVRKYGISLEQYDEMYQRQAGCCALCERPFERLNVDHDHETGRVRGLLCLSCNQAIGKLGDNEEGILRALTYVRGEFVV